MTDKKWDDNKIDNLLGSMPDIQDERLKSDILMRLKQDERLHPPRRHTQKKWVPALVVVAALLMFSLLIPSMLKNNEGAMDKAVESVSLKHHEMEMSTDDATEDRAELANNVPETRVVGEAKLLMDVQSHVLLQEDLQGFQPLQIGLIADDHITVPMTFLIPAERVVADFSKGQPDSVALYNQYAAGIPGKELGFAEMELVARVNPQPYYKMVMPTGQQYLTPSESENVLTVEKALLVMKESHDSALEELVPANLLYDVEEKQGVAVITFTEPLDLTGMDQIEAGAMIEGFMLTAKSFNKQVRLENVIQDTFLRYDLTIVLPEPVGVNPTYYVE
ncbi:hypothetical protein [Sporosarcina sp. NPDC096371]|uniref:hypothetical protein n=1 Tax=Sporosarcina sp. NPDC096371 TaxID=3364530 RepID=UPI003821752E